MTLPLAAASIGVPTSAGKSMPSWNALLTSERIDAPAEVGREPAVLDGLERRQEFFLDRVRHHQCLEDAQLVRTLVDLP